MARVTLCDRCGRSTKADYDRSFISRHRCRWEKVDVDYICSESKTYYLCGDCSKQLQKFLDEKPKER